MRVEYTLLFYFICQVSNCIGFNFKLCNFLIPYKSNGMTCQLNMISFQTLSFTTQPKLQYTKIDPSLIGTTPLNLTNTISYQNTIMDAIENLEIALKKEIYNLKLRIDGIEKNVGTLQTGKSKTAVGNFVDSLAATTIEMNPRTVEICAVVSFFGIGTIIGFSLLDRLWLLGGIISAWWYDCLCIFLPLVY